MATNTLTRMHLGWMAKAASEKEAGAAILGSYADEMTHFMIDVLDVPQFEAELAVGQLWDRWVRAYNTTYPTMPVGTAESALTAALRYLTSEETEGQAPGPLADSGWHVILSHDTRCFTALSYAALGKYRHHVPNDVLGINKNPNEKCNSTNDGGGSSKCVCS